MIGCNQQKVVDGSEQKDQLNSIGSQVRFSLDPSVSISNSYTTSVVGLNTKLGTKLSIFSDSQCQSELAIQNVQSSITRFNFTFFSEQSIHFYYQIEDVDFKKSNCLDTKITYTVDNTPPVGPSAITLAQTIGNNPKPFISILGVEAGDRIRIYSSSTCSHKIGEVLASGPSAFISPTSALPFEATFNLHYKIEDLAGNEKSQGPTTCIDSTQTYTLDQTAPNLPSSIVFNGNQAIDNESIIDIDFQNDESDLEAILYINSNYTLGGFQSGFSIINTLNSTADFSSFPSGLDYNIYYRLRDRAGNYLTQGNSTCVNSGLTYHYDIGSPITPILENISTKSVLINNQPTVIDYPIVGERKILNIKASSLEVGTTIKIYPQTLCNGTALIDEVVTSSISNYTVSLPAGGTYQLSARLEDSAGNESSCSNEIDYKYKEIKNISIGLHHTCANFHDGETYCFGRNNKGQLGIGSISDSESIPRKVSSGVPFTSVTTGLNHTCHLDTDGDIWCNGDNQFKQVGDANTATSFSSPQETQVGQNYLKIASGDRHNCAINSTGNVLCFGSNSSGQSGELIMGGSFEAAQVGQLGTITNASSLSLGGAHSCVTTTTGQLYCFGQNYILNGDDETELSSSPTPSLIGDYDGIDISAGTNTTCLQTDLLPESKVMCFGNGQKNKRGDSTQLDSHIPIAISNTSEFKFISTGNDRTCLINSNYELLCFGNGYSGVQKISTTKKFTQFEVGHEHDCGVSTNGEVFCRGSNNFGQLGSAGPSNNVDFSTVDFRFDQASLIISEGSNYCINSQSNQLEFNNELNSYPTKDFTLNITNIGSANAFNVTENISTNEIQLLSNTCGSIIAPGVNCQLNLRFSPVEPHPNGTAYQLRLDYQDELDSRAVSIDMHGYSLRTLKDLDFAIDGNSIPNLIEFNDAFSSLNANLLEEITKVVTIENNSSENMNIEQAVFYGEDSFHFKYGSNNVFPGQNGTCTGTISPQTSCTIEITYSPKLASMGPPDFSHRTSFRMLIRQGLLLTTTDLPLKGFSYMNSPIIAPYADSAVVSSLFYLNYLNNKLIYQESTTLEETFEFKNDSTTAARIQQKSILDPDNQYNILSDTCSTNLVLQAGESCEMTVEYSPDQASIVTGHELSITIDYRNEILPLDDGHTSNVQVRGFAQSF